MFSHSTDFLYKVRAVGEIHGQFHQQISLDPYFSYPANRYTNRADEMSRKPEDLEGLVAFFCQDNPRVTHIQVVQERYDKVPGRIPDLQQGSGVVEGLLPPTPCP